MRIAFYAPMKPPDHPVPSGDRRMARAFCDLLARLGHEVELASRLRSYDRDGDPLRQQRLPTSARGWLARLVRRYRRRRAGAAAGLWFTYHLYHKAPDWLGPSVEPSAGASPTSWPRRRSPASRRAGPGRPATRRAGQRSRRPTWCWP